MIEDDFYATIKFKSGEEIFAKVAASEEVNRTVLLISNPIMVSEVKVKMEMTGYKVEPWLKTSKDDMFMVDLSEVLTNVRIHQYVEMNINVSKMVERYQLGQKIMNLN